MNKQIILAVLVLEEAYMLKHNETSTTTVTTAPFLAGIIVSLLICPHRIDVFAKQTVPILNSGEI